MGDLPKIVKMLQVIYLKDNYQHNVRLNVQTYFRVINGKKLTKFDNLLVKKIIYVRQKWQFFEKSTFSINKPNFDLEWFLNNKLCMLRPV